MMAFLVRLCFSSYIRYHGYMFLVCLATAGCVTISDKFVPGNERALLPASLTIGIDNLREDALVGSCERVMLLSEVLGSSVQPSLNFIQAINVDNYPIIAVVTGAHIAKERRLCDVAEKPFPAAWCFHTLAYKFDDVTFLKNTLAVEKTDLFGAVFEIKNVPSVLTSGIKLEPAVNYIIFVDKAKSTLWSSERINLVIAAACVAK